MPFELGNTIRLWPDEVRADPPRNATRAQPSEPTAWQRERFKASAVADLSGDPPSHLSCDTTGLGPQRALYARYAAWQLHERRNLQELEDRRDKIQEVIDGVETEVRNGIRRLANAYIMGSAHEGETDKTLARDLLAQRRVEAAKIAKPEIEQQIERAKLRVERLDEREREFLRGAMLEVADESGLGEAYLKAITRLQQVTELITGLMQTIGRGWDAKITSNQTFVDLPRLNLPSIAKADFRDFRLSIEGNTSFWQGLETSIKLDPRHKAHVPLK